MIHDGDLFSSRRLYFSIGFHVCLIFDLLDFASASKVFCSPSKVKFKLAAMLFVAGFQARLDVETKVQSLRMLSTVRVVAVDLQRHPWQTTINCGFLLAEHTKISRKLVQVLARGE